MSLRLRIEHGQDAGTTWRLPKPGVYTIGRQPTNSMRVLDMKVSKEHCEIRLAQQNGRTQAVLVDSISTTGCQLNGQPVPKNKNVAIKPGDELRLGLTILRVLSDGDADQDVKPVAGREVDEGAVAGAGRHGDEGKTKQTLPADALVGKELSGYTIDRKIGQGGMGGVYLAEQTSLQRKVALKVLNETFAADSAFVDQFVNEARAAGALNHPNVVQVYDVGSAQGHYFFSMEVMPGGSIEDKVKDGPVAWEDGLNWFIDSANALIFAKRREILHRDVKPDNLMIAEDGSSKLCDLGLAKKSEVGDLMDQGIIGTPHFISPEAIRRKGDIDHRTDLYSLGCSFYRIFTGKNPYPGTSVKEILLGHLNKPIPRINDANRNVPRELDEIVYQLMRKDPEDRVQTPEELLRQLDKIRTQYNLEAHGIKPASKKPLVIGLVAALLAIGGAIFFVTTREDKERVIDLTPQQKQAALDAARTNAEKPLSDYVITAERKFNGLNTEYLNGKIEDDDDQGNPNWKKQVFKDISRKLKTAVEGWEGKLTTWAKKKKGVKDDVIRGFYDKYATALQGHIASANNLRTGPKGIDTYIARRTRNAKRFNEERATARKQIDADVDKYARKLKQLFDDGKYLELERTLLSSELADLVKEALAKEVDGDKLLKEEKDVTPVLDKQLPPDKDGKRGMKWIAEAVRRLGITKGEAVNAARKALGTKPSFVQFQAARDLLKAWLDTVPPVLDDEDAPTISRAYRRAKGELERRRSAIKKKADDYENALYAADRQTYFQFLVDIWAPRTGLLRHYELGVARDKAEKLGTTLKHGKYRELAKTWPAPLAALEALFADLVKAYEGDGWTEKYALLPDKKGKLKKESIKAIDGKSVKIDRDTYVFEQMGSAWLLDKIFFVDGKPRLKACTHLNHFGLGMLAELAGDYKLAMTQYQKAAQTTDAKLTAAVRARMTTAAKEAPAAEIYLAIVAFLRRAEAWADESERRLAENRAKPGKMSDDERADLETREGPRFEKDLQSFQIMKDRLNEEAGLAVTTWGSAIRETLHSGVAYAGEKLPEKKKPVEPPKPPPKKDDDKKGDGKKGEDAKSPKDAGPKKNGK